MSTGGLSDTQLSRILEVGRGLVSELDLEAVLRQVLEAARELTSARYAALGVLDEEKSELERFIFTGIDSETRELIGALPRGQGILGELIRHPEPLRLKNLGDHPRSYGFPPNHPPMSNFLGVPVMIRGEAYGNLYLTEKQTEAEFGDQDEQLLIVLAEWVAIAIDNARNYERAESGRSELERAVRGLEANASLSRELGGESDPGRVLELIAKRGRALLDSRSCAILLREDDGFAVAECAGELAGVSCDRSLPARNSPADDVLRAGAGQRLDGIGVEWFRAAGIEASSAVIAPLSAPGRVEGVIAALDPGEERSPFGADDVLLLSSFASAAATVIASSRAIESEKLELSIESSEQERRRWARELHDETLQELGALKVLHDSVPRGDAAAMGAALDKASAQVENMITNLEGLISELRPAALDQLGAQAAIEAMIERLKDRNELAIEADFDLEFEEGRAPSRHTPELESTLYRVTQEGLNNVVKHAEADEARIAITENNGQVSVTIEDDGRGIADNDNRADGGFGLLGMRERVALAGGEMEVGPGSRGGTRLTVRLPAVRRD
jgi:signal transduction histidine kinase